jgi:hypothetical protein
VGDKERQNSASIRDLQASKGQGRNRERHPVAVGLRSKPGTQPRALAERQGRLREDVFSAVR